MAPLEYEFGKNRIVSNGERVQQQMLVSWMVLSDRVALLSVFLQECFCFVLEGIAEKEEILNVCCVTFRTIFFLKKELI